MPRTRPPRPFHPVLTVLGALALVLSTPAEAGRKNKKNKKDQQEDAAPSPADAAEEAVEPTAASAPVAYDIVLPCDWPEGTAYTYASRRHRTDARNPLLEQLHTEYQVTVTVTGSGDPARFRYATSDPSVQGPEALAAPTLASLQAQLAAVPDLELRMEGGVVVAVENFQEVADATWSLLQPTLDARGASPAARAQSEQMIRSPETGMAVQLQEPAPFFAMHCGALNVGEVIEYEEAFPNPLGGPPIPGFSRITLTAHDPAAQQITVETLTRSSPGAMESILAGAKQQAINTGQSEAEVEATLEQARAAISSIDVVSTGRLIYSTADGMPDFIETRKQIGSGDQVSRVDTRTWTRTGTAEGSK